MDASCSPCVPLQVRHSSCLLAWQQGLLQLHMWEKTPFNRTFGQTNPEIHFSGASSPPKQNFGGFPDWHQKAQWQPDCSEGCRFCGAIGSIGFIGPLNAPSPRKFVTVIYRSVLKNLVHTDVHELPVIHVHFGDEFFCSVGYPFQPNVFQLLPWWLIWLVLTRKRIQSLVTCPIVSRSCQMPHHWGTNPSWGWTVWDFSIFRVCEFMPAAVVGTDCNYAFTAFEACMAAFWAAAPSSLWFAGTPVALPSR